MLLATRCGNRQHFSLQPLPPLETCSTKHALQHCVGNLGAALHAGVDVRVGERGAIRVDARWIDIDSDVKVDGAKLGTANIDPLVYGVAYVVKF